MGSICRQMASGQVENEHPGAESPARNLQLVQHPQNGCCTHSFLTYFLIIILISTQLFLCTLTAKSLQWESHLKNKGPGAPGETEIPGQGGVLIRGAVGLQGSGLTPRQRCFPFGQLFIRKGKMGDLFVQHLETRGTEWSFDSNS